MPVHFSLGQITQTNGVKAVFTPDEYEKCLARHKAGDWGDVTSDDRRVNDDALDHEGRILSSYKFKDRRNLWILTEANRSATTLLLPSEYRWTAGGAL